MSVPIQLNRIGRIPLSPTVNRIGTTRNTTVNMKTNSLTIFVPAAFYLVRWWCCSKQKSSGELESSHHAKISVS